MFKCNNDRCIDQELACNGVDECGDLSDELNCGKTEINRKNRKNLMYGGRKTSPRPSS